MWDILYQIKLDFEQWVIETNQGYDLQPNQSGRMQTYEMLTTEHAWRGFCYGSLRHRTDVPSSQHIPPTP
jgi:hypothetical protein